MALALRGTPQTATAASQTNLLSLDLPAGLVAGDVILVAVAADNLTPVQPQGSGWNEIGSRSLSASQTLTLSVYGKRLEVGETIPTTVTLRLPGSMYNVASMAACSLALRGAPALPVDVTAWKATDGTPAATLDCASITTTVDKCWMLTFSGATDSASATPNAGMTERVDVAVDGWYQHLHLYVASLALGAAGSTGTKAHTASTSTESVNFSVAIKPDTTAQQLTLGTETLPLAVGVVAWEPTLSTEAVPDAIDELIEEVDLGGGGLARLWYVVHATAYDESTASELEFYWSTEGYNDGGLAQVVDGMLTDVPGVESTVLNQGAVGGGASQSFDSLTLPNQVTTFGEAGDLDDYETYAWDGRRVEVRICGTRANGTTVEWANGYRLFSALATGIATGRERVTLNLEPLDVAFDKPVQATKFAGTGGAEGGDDLKGKSKPLVLGYCYDVPMTLVDPVDLVYVVSAPGGIAAVTAVYDGGAELLPSQYVVSLSAGTITLNQSPAFAMTADVVGIRAAGKTAASMVRWLSSDYGIGPLDWPSQVSLDSFQAFRAAQPAKLGLYLPTGEETTIRDALHAVLAPTGWWSFDRRGRLIMGRVELPAASASHAFVDGEVVLIERLPNERPAWSVILGWKRCWTPQDASSVAGIILGTDRETFLANEWRTARAEDADRKVPYPRAQEMPQVDTAFVLQAEAEAEAARILPIMSWRWELLAVMLPHVAHSCEIGDTVQITSADELAGSSGKLFVVVGKRIAQDTGHPIRLLWRAVEPIATLLDEDSAALLDEDGAVLIEE